MSTDDNPFDSGDIEAAFPEFRVCIPHLGAGTFKVAYRITPESGPDQVLKLVKEALDAPDAELPTRLDREISGMKRVQSDHVAHIIGGPDVTLIGATHHVYYREPYYADGTLDTLLGTPLDRNVVGRLANDLFLGVTDLWDERIVHRDIKPKNIALVDGRAVLLDLGIAYFTDLTPATDAFAQSPRTPVYAAPEQFEVRRLAQIDHRTDQFQVGLVLFEALTGSHPFNPNDPTGYFSRLDNGLVDECALDDAEISADLRGFLRRLLASAPNRRYRTPALAHAAAVEAFR